jgi:hypothetical protein
MQFVVLYAHVVLYFREFLANIYTVINGRAKERSLYVPQTENFT